MRHALVLAIALLLPAAALAEVGDLATLARSYDDQSCRGCHQRIYDEWKGSLHAQSVVHSLPGMKTFLTAGLERWKATPTKEHLMRCLHCHAPAMAEASETLGAEVAALILAAAGGQEEARAKLGTLNVGCVVCHSTHAVLEPNLRGPARRDVLYGPTGTPTTAHKTEKSPAHGSSLFCSQCHSLYTPPDGDTLYCNTLFGSYQDGYRAAGGAESCQDCHMRKQGRGHTFPGAYSVELVREGIAIDVQATGVKLVPGTWTPTLFVTVGLTNAAGHRIPDG